MFDEYVKDNRKKNNLSQEELAEVIGVSTKTIHNWEKGIKKPSGDNYVKLQQLFGKHQENDSKNNQIINHETKETKLANTSIEVHENEVCNEHNMIYKKRITAHEMDSLITYYVNSLTIFFACFMKIISKINIECIPYCLAVEAIALILFYKWDFNQLFYVTNPVIYDFRCCSDGFVGKLDKTLLIISDRRFWFIMTPIFNLGFCFMSLNYFHTVSLCSIYFAAIHIFVTLTYQKIRKSLPLRR